MVLKCRVSLTETTIYDQNVLRLSGCNMFMHMQHLLLGFWDKHKRTGSYTTHFYLLFLSTQSAWYNSSHSHLFIQARFDGFLFKSFQSNILTFKLWWMYWSCQHSCKKHFRWWICYTDSYIWLHQIADRFLKLIHDFYIYISYLCIKTIIEKGCVLFQKTS